MISEVDTLVVLMVNTSNTFNSIDKEAFLHNTKLLCPALVTFIRNCYSVPSDPFVQGGKCLKLLEGTTQGDPGAMELHHC